MQGSIISNNKDLLIGNYLTSEESLNNSISISRYHSTGSSLIIENYDNTSMYALIFKNGLILTEGEDYVIENTGNVIFYIDISSTSNIDCIVFTSQKQNLARYNIIVEGATLQDDGSYVGTIDSNIILTLGTQTEINPSLN